MNTPDAFVLDTGPCGTRLGDPSTRATGQYIKMPKGRPPRYNPRKMRAYCEKAGLPADITESMVAEAAAAEKARFEKIADRSPRMENRELHQQYVTKRYHEQKELKRAEAVALAIPGATPDPTKRIPSYQKVQGAMLARRILEQVDAEALFVSFLADTVDLRIKLDAAKFLYEQAWGRATMRAEVQVTQNGPGAIAIFKDTSGFMERAEQIIRDNTLDAETVDDDTPRGGGGDGTDEV